MSKENATPIKNVVRLWDGWFYISRSEKWKDTELFRFEKGVCEFVGNPHGYTLDELKECYPDALIAEHKMGLEDLLR